MNKEEITFIDSNIIIYVLMKDPEYGERALRHLYRVESGEIRGVMSTLVLSQIYAHLKRRGKMEVIEKFSSYVEESPIYIIDTTYSDFLNAWEIKKEYNLTWKIWDDLVIAAQMRRAGITNILSNDVDFDKIPFIKRIF